MALARDYAAEYARRQELAEQRGFSSYSEERAFRRETSFEREIAGESAEYKEMHPGIDWRQENPQQLAAFYENVVEPSSRGVTGLDRHNAVAYYIEYEDMSEDEAVAAMRENFGDSE